MVSMAEPITPLPLTSSRADHIFPTLTSAQIAVVATHGDRRAVCGGEVLVEQGDRAIPFFVVISGQLEAAYVDTHGERGIRLKRLPSQRWEWVNCCNSAP
jgi:CRP-like cAMP-binding protein